MDYIEQLNTIEWKEKRREILKRDNYKCQNCNNEHLLVEKNGVLVSLRGDEPKRLGIKVFNDRHYRALLFYNDLEYKINNQIGYFIEREDINIIIAIREITDNEIAFQKSIIDAEIKKRVNEELVFRGYELTYEDKKIEKFQLKINPKDFEWIYCSGLHVHHKNYQNGRMAWEYPNDALITLCFDCHEKLHKGVKVPKLDENGKQIGLLTPCDRCHGAGWLPQYRHVEKGVCFKCNGARYNELAIV